MCENHGCARQALLGLDISGLGKTSLKAQLWCHCSRLAFGTWEQGPLGVSLESWRGPEQLSWLQGVGGGSRKCRNEEKLQFMFGFEGTFKTQWFHGQGHLPLEGRKGKPWSRGAAMLQKVSLGSVPHCHGAEGRPCRVPSGLHPAAHPALDELGHPCESCRHTKTSL